MIVVITTFSSEETLTFPPEGLSLRWYVTFWDILTGNPPPGVPGRFWEALIGTVTVAAFVTVIGLFAGHWRHLPSTGGYFAGGSLSAPCSCSRSCFLPLSWR